MEEKIKVKLKGIGELTFNKGVKIIDIIKSIKVDDEKKYLGAMVENEVRHLEYPLVSDCNVELLDITHKDGLRIYTRTLSFIYIKACKDLFGDATVTIEHSLSKGLYSEIHKDNNFTLDDVKKIKTRMQEIISEDIKIKREQVSTDRAIQIFTNQKMFDKVNLIKNLDKDKMHLYSLEGYYDSFYGHLAPSTGYIKSFDLVYYPPGIIIMFPRKESNFKIPKFEQQNKLAKVFKEAETWGDILDIGYVSNLNERILNGTIKDIILISEALHEKKIAYIADKIAEDEDKRIILIAGPSSSGKTTFAQRLSIQLQTSGKKPVSISLDDYFVDREKTPKDENGEYDFESIEAIDIEKFNEDLLRLIAGEEVHLPTYNFIKGVREYRGRILKIEKDQPIIIEGIHGLNDRLTSAIPKNNKFKIYVSALTQLNIDSHNRIPTTDLRLIRRIVRDSKYRGNDAKRTLQLWASVRRGEERNIFPFQEQADVMFNSALVYELSVLKKYAIPLLKKIGRDVPYYAEAKRLLKFLSYFKDIDDESIIPNTSILREFIGGSCFREE
ncbi:nucleoside kinase [Caloranaerobacter sp. DY30410]|uniref:uridine kinase family protein n=1 Tax=Caloranaerobacter sp. DY30410 TaxID=3238305 RepID=UPI003D00B574